MALSKIKSLCYVLKYAVLNHWVRCGSWHTCHDWDQRETKWTSSAAVWQPHQQSTNDVKVPNSQVSTPQWEDKTKPQLALTAGHGWFSQIPTWQSRLVLTAVTESCMAGERILRWYVSPSTKISILNFLYSRTVIWWTCLPSTENHKWPAWPNSYRQIEVPLAQTVLIQRSDTQNTG